MQCGRPLAAAASAGHRVVPPGEAVPGRSSSESDATSVTARPLPSEGAGVELVACPSCGASNAARRLQCGRCGTRLRPTSGRPTGERHPGAGDDEDQDWLLVPATPDDPETAAPRRRRRGAALVVITFGVVVGTVLGLAAGMGVGPFATHEPVSFDAMAYPDDPTVLRPATASSSSTADPAGERAFDPGQTVDGDLGTAWRADGEDEGALVRHGYVAPVWVTRIEVATGDQADDATFAAAGRVTEAMVDLGTMQVEATLAGVEGVQVLRLPRPVLTDEITWEVTDLAGGPAAISEVRYVGWNADDEDRRAYEER